MNIERSHPLDAPIWWSLATHHRDFAEGDLFARRYPAGTAPFAAMADISPKSYASLARIIPKGGQVALFTTEKLEPPPEFLVVARTTIEQMVMVNPQPKITLAPYEVMTGNDVQEMISLVQKTNPGPFFTNTPDLGAFIGIREKGNLIAMAGERMRLPHFTEVSTICVHPDHRRLGRAQGLIAALVEQIIERNETPFLHVLSSNSVAISLYEKLGFSIRSTLFLYVLKHSLEPL